MAFVAGDPAGFPKALVMGDFRLSRSRQRFVNGSGFIVLLPADAANHDSIVKRFLFVWARSICLLFHEHHYRMTDEADFKAS